MSETVEVLRRSLWPFSFFYSLATAARNLAYDAGTLRSHGLEVPVISVGNLTVGGTGKTPLVIWLCERARAIGRRPGVLARGYGRQAGAELNDEGLLLASRFPDLPQVQDADRVRGGRRLVAGHDVDLVVLDDGFQHRRLARDVDILCLDATRPFAQNKVLPAGDLREPRTGVRRADLVVLTRAGALGADELGLRREGIRRIARRDLPIHAAEHEPTGLRSEPDGASLPPEALHGRRVHLLSAIARPGSFESTAAARLGMDVRRHQRRRDHHLHTADEVRSAVAEAEADGAVLVTTEKDAVKFGELDLPHFVLCIGLRFLDRDPDPRELGLQ